jgi:Na+/pantothenate symporter
MAVGISSLMVWIALGLRQDLHEVFPALLLSTLTYYLLSKAEATTETAAKP